MDDDGDHRRDHQHPVGHRVQHLAHGRYLVEAAGHEPVDPVGRPEGAQQDGRRRLPIGAEQEPEEQRDAGQADERDPVGDGQDPVGAGLGGGGSGHRGSGHRFGPVPAEARSAPSGAGPPSCPVVPRSVPPVVGPLIELPLAFSPTPFTRPSLRAGPSPTEHAVPPGTHRPPGRSGGRWRGRGPCSGRDTRGAPPTLAVPGPRTHPSAVVAGSSAPPAHRIPRLCPGGIACHHRSEQGRLVSMGEITESTGSSASRWWRCWWPWWASASPSDRPRALRPAGIAVSRSGTGSSPARSHRDDGCTRGARPFGAPDLGATARPPRRPRRPNRPRRPPRSRRPWPDRSPRSATRS